MNGGQPVNINVTKYLEEKAAGTMRIINIEGQLHFVEKKFDQKTGVATPVIVPIDIEQMKATQKQFKEQYEGISALIADAEATQKT